MAPSAALLPLHEHLRRHARAIPDRTAYLWYGHALTWAELDAASDAFAARLQALGVQKGEPVALFMNNCPQYLMAHYGIQKIGAIVCPCGPLNKEHELQYQLDDLKARVIVAADVLLPVVEQVRAQTALGLPVDARDFVLAKHILDYLQVASVHLMTNNPQKVATLNRVGIDVAERVPLEVGQNSENAHYLSTKAQKLGHMLG